MCVCASICVYVYVHAYMCVYARTNHDRQDKATDTQSYFQKPTTEQHLVIPSTEANTTLRCWQQYLPDTRQKQYLPDTQANSTYRFWLQYLPDTHANST